MHALLGHSILAITACALAVDPPFDSYWHDGKAELDGYRLRVSRYGEPREGQAVMVFVTEPFSESKRVKVEDPAKDPADTFDALKLNLVRDFQTGIYDYNTMVSVFVRSRDLAPVKVSFSSAEWCGNVHEELWVHPGHIAQQVLSYFENESRSVTLPRPAGGLLEDQLYIWVRGLRGAPLRPGQKRRVAFLPGAFHRRLVHRPAAWSSAELERLASPQRVRVPAGVFAADVYVVRPADGREGRFWVEQAHPHRIVKWSWRAAGPGSADGGADGGELTGTARLPYWTLHRNGDESYREALGLSPLGR